MTQLTDDKRACVIMFVPVAGILNKLCDYQFVFSVLDELYVSHHALMQRVIGPIQRVHYKSMKYDVFIFTR